MDGPWLVSYVVLWAVVLFQGGVIFLLLRQLGVIYLGTAQGVAGDGVAVGERAPQFAARLLDGGEASLAVANGRPLLLVFGSPTCGPCRSLVPDLNAFAGERADELSVLFLSRGDEESARRFLRETGAGVPIAVYADDRPANDYKVRVTPFAFIIDAGGVVRAKGLANNREHLDFMLRMAVEEGAKGQGRSGRNGTPATPRVEERA